MKMSAKQSILLRHSSIFIYFIFIVDLSSFNGHSDIIREKLEKVLRNKNEILFFYPFHLLRGGAIKRESWSLEIN